jgi:DNA-binding response OmpR family regulator
MTEHDGPHGPWPELEALAEAKILIIDDLATNIALLERILSRVGYRHFHSTTDPREALQAFNEYQPDLVLLDLQMPHLDGFQVLEQLASLRHGGASVPIVILTADTARESKMRALKLGARDFLTKPFDAAEIILRIRNLVESRSLHVQLCDQNVLLEERVEERTRTLEMTQRQLLESEQEKKRFYREVILAVTNGKFHLVDEEDIAVAGELVADVSLDGPEGYATPGRGERRDGGRSG